MLRNYKACATFENCSWWAKKTLISQVTKIMLACFIQSIIFFSVCERKVQTDRFYAVGLQACFCVVSSSLKMYCRLK
jgi:hypothetical protein